MGMKLQIRSQQNTLKCMKNVGGMVVHHIGLLVVTNIIREMKLVE